MSGLAKPLGWFIVLITLAGCTPLDKIYSHEFSDGYFRLKSQKKGTESVYVKLKGDTIKVFNVARVNGIRNPDTASPKSVLISSVNPENPLFNSTFRKTSVDIDLSTVLLKLRPSAGDVPQQLSTNVNGVFYAGFRKDYFHLKNSISELHEASSFIRHTGFDFGIFAGIGITPVNPTVTMSRTIQEYDGIVFQKGFSVFATYENMSVGLAIGFDNLLDHNRVIWIYNNKPWFGLVLGIANF